MKSRLIVVRGSYALPYRVVAAAEAAEIAVVPRMFKVAILWQLQ